MFNVRLMFEKTGTAAYISHLDLMKTLQRCFLRAKLPVKYSEGFNPHINLSILVPLSTGYRSSCELCDFELTCDGLPEDIVPRLNAVMPQGLSAVKAGQAIRPAKQIAYCQYDILYPAGDAADMADAFASPVTVEKKSKRGSRNVNLQDYIKNIEFEQRGDGVLCRCTLKAGDDPLNPVYITSALMQKGILPSDIAPQYTRRGILDENCQIFF